METELFLAFVLAVSNMVWLYVHETRLNKMCSVCPFYLDAKKDSNESATTPK